MILKGLFDGGITFKGNYQYPLPTIGRGGVWLPGAWTPALAGDLCEAQNGYHLATNETILNWLLPWLFEAEASDEHDRCPECGSIIARQARLLRHFLVWNAATARGLAVRAARAALVRAAVSDADCVLALDWANMPSPMLAVANRRAWAAAARVRAAGRPAFAVHAALAVYYATLPVIWPNVMPALWLAASCDPAQPDAVRLESEAGLLGVHEVIYLSPAIRRAQYVALMGLLAQDTIPVAG